MKAHFIEVDKHEKRVRPFQIEVPREPLRVQVKKPVTMRLLEDVEDYFKDMADESGVLYQSLINLYLRDCLANSRKVQINRPNASTAA